MLHDARPIAFVATTDPARALTFYRDVLGLALVADEPFALVFDLAGTMLRIAKVEQLVPQPHTVLGWIVEDISAAVAGLRAQGAEPARYPGMEQDELGIWRSPGGALLTWFRDPDGNTLSLTQLP